MNFTLTRKMLAYGTRIVAVALGIMFAMASLPGNAKADGTYRWQNAYWPAYLNVRGASKADGAQVIIFRLSGTSNELWADNKLSSGYYRLRAVHSWKALDHNASTGPAGTSEARCDVVTYRWHGARWQQWEYRKYWSARQGRHFVMWQNLHGCDNDPYHDTLGTIVAYANTFLYRRSYCEAVPEVELMCSWKRNGK